MAKRFACRDIGLACDFSAQAETVDQLMPQVAEHARTAHSMAQIDEATKAKIMAAIKEA